MFRKLIGLLQHLLFGSAYSGMIENTNYSSHGFVETNHVDLFYHQSDLQGKPSVGQDRERPLTASTGEHRGSILNSKQNVLLASYLTYMKHLHIFKGRNA